MSKTKKSFTNRLCLAENFDPAQAVFPLIGMPKIDGVRGGNTAGILLGRRGRPHNNKYITEVFSKPDFIGLDGELTTSAWNSPDVVTITSGDLNTINSIPENVCWNVFDDMSPDARDLPYNLRLMMLTKRVESIHERMPQYKNLIRLVPYQIINSLEEHIAYEEMCLQRGFEGAMYRNPTGSYKEGRSTVADAVMLRVKRFVENEAIVIDVVEGQKNNNPATLNGIGLTKRSQAKENLSPSGRIDSLICKKVGSDEIIRVGCGKMKHADRIKYFNNPGLILGKIIKYKEFPKGAKDKPRQPTFQSFRISSDME